MKSIIILLLLFITSSGKSQNKITGIVTNSKSGAPIEFATVYIDGTTKGTYTDDKGRFSLENLQLPSTLVVNYMRYKTNIINLEKNQTLSLSVKLDESEFEIEEIIVEGKNYREKTFNCLKSIFWH